METCVGCCTLTTPNTMHTIKIKHCLVHLNKEGVVMGQALKCSASEALNAESYNTLRFWYNTLKE